MKTNQILVSIKNENSLKNWLKYFMILRKILPRF